MRGVLLDTHALYWLVTGIEKLSDEALVAIGNSQRTGTLYVSPVSAWEIALAAQKPRNPTELDGMTAGTWFQAAIREAVAKIAPINQRIAIEAANVVANTGHRDPGDCYLIATARVKRIAIITRDSLISGLSKSGYLDAILC